MLGLLRFPPRKWVPLSYLKSPNLSSGFVMKKENPTQYMIIVIFLKGLGLYFVEYTGQSPLLQTLCIVFLQIRSFINTEIHYLFSCWKFVCTTKFNYGRNSLFNAPVKNVIRKKLSGWWNRQYIHTQKKYIATKILRSRYFSSSEWKKLASSLVEPYLAT